MPDDPDALPLDWNPIEGADHLFVAGDERAFALITPASVVAASSPRARDLKYLTRLVQKFHLLMTLDHSPLGVAANRAKTELGLASGDAEPIGGRPISLVAMRTGHEFFLSGYAHASLRFGSGDDATHGYLAAPEAVPDIELPKFGWLDSEPLIQREEFSGAGSTFMKRGEFPRWYLRGDFSLDDGFQMWPGEAFPLTSAIAKQPQPLRGIKLGIEKRLIRLRTDGRADQWEFKPRRLGGGCS